MPDMALFRNFYRCTRCNLRIVRLWLPAAYAQLGRLDEARAEAAEVLRIEPAFTIEKWKCTAVYRNPEDAEHSSTGRARWAPRKLRTSSVSRMSLVGHQGTKKHVSDGGSFRRKRRGGLIPKIARVL
jgi:hypothetical protein